MTDSEHLEFVSSVITKYGLDAVHLGQFDPSTPGQIVESLTGKTPGESLLGMSLAAWLIDRCLESADLVLLLNLTEQLTSALEQAPSESPNDLVMTSLWVRSVLFWQYVRGGNKESHLIKTEAKLLAACLAARPDCHEQAEFVLTQCYRT